MDRMQPSGEFPYPLRDAVPKILPKMSKAPFRQVCNPGSLVRHQHGDGEHEKHETGQKVSRDM